MSRTGIMLAYPLEESRLQKWNPPYLVQPKLDGDRCRAIHHLDCSINLLSSEENEFESVPHIRRELRNLNIHSLEFDGELYIHGWTHPDIHSIVSRKENNLHPDFGMMEYHIFDIVINKPQYARLMHLKDFKDVIAVNRLMSVKIVPIYECKTLDEIMRMLEGFKDDGYEGVIIREKNSLYVRKRSIYMMKFKPRKEDIYRIVGFKEERDKHGNLKGRLGSLIVVSAEGVKFAVGSGLTNEDRTNLWWERDELAGRLVTVKYQHTSKYGVPRFPVFYEILKEDNHDDLSH